MYRWLIGRLARRAATQAVAGRPGSAVWSMAGDIRFIFPGSSSLACDLTGKDSVAAWLRRLIALRPGCQVLDVVVSGPPGTRAPRSGSATPSRATATRASVRGGWD